MRTVLAPAAPTVSAAAGLATVQTITVENTGAEPLALSAPVLSGDAAFELGQTSCGTRLDAGATCAVDVRYFGTEDFATAELTVETSTGTLTSLLFGSQDGTSVANEAATEGAFGLSAAFPNPVQGAARIAYSLAQAETVTLSVYDALGRRVAVLAEGPMSAGTHEARFDAEALASGVYFYRLQAGSQSAVRKLTVLR